MSGLIAPKLNSGLRLPAAWNHELRCGGGGFNGSTPPANAGALGAGDAQVSSGSGHQGSGLESTRWTC